MDILNPLYLKVQKLIRTSAEPNSVVYLATPDPKRDDKFLTMAVPIENLAEVIGALTTVETDGVTITGDGTLANPLVAAAASSFTYEIGQYVASEGGVIAHRWLSTSAGGSPTAGTVQNYLVLDTNNVSSSSVWSNIDILVSGAVSTWDGQTNTNLIIGQPGATTGAAFLCANSINNGQTDWYLPAIDELNKVWNNRWEIAQGISNAGGIQLSQDKYWSSTELGKNTAQFFIFDNGFADPSLKSNAHPVRAVRKFSI